LTNGPPPVFHCSAIMPAVLTLRTTPSVELGWENVLRCSSPAVPNGRSVLPSCRVTVTWATELDLTVWGSTIAPNASDAGRVPRVVVVCPEMPVPAAAIEKSEPCWANLAGSSVALTVS
jgi:hypothetical protein